MRPAQGHKAPSATLPYKTLRRVFLAALSGSHMPFCARPTPTHPKTPLQTRQFDISARRFTRHATRDNSVRETRKWLRELVHAIRNTRHGRTLHATRTLRYAPRSTRPAKRDSRKLTRDTLHAIRENIKTETQHATRDLRHAREQTCKTMI